MADSAAFELVCEALEQDTQLDRLESRGTLRLALKQAGLAAADVTGDQLSVVLRKILSSELESRGVSDPARVCAALVERLSSLGPAAETRETPDAVFARLAQS